LPAVSFRLGKIVSGQRRRGGAILTVTRTAQAASLLLDKWPHEKRDRPKYRLAVKAVMEVMEQRKTVSVARKAFTAAAKDADYLSVRDGTKNCCGERAMF
jgi:hypothetical protein